MICTHCNQTYSLNKSKVWWNEDGVWSQKLSECPHCNKVNTVKFELLFELDVNNDERYYNYSRRNSHGRFYV